ncbi:MAG: tRNA (adenosine(37)-N6)-threonylcarbamoyltransferase complex transferase subunit TsaD [Bacteroidota bacterium]
MAQQDIYILAIESSCDDTGAAVCRNEEILCNMIAGQLIHEQYGGVVPELASRAHQQHIVPLVDAALKKAGINKSQLHAIAFTQGPGLIGSLLVGSSFAKSMAHALGIPLIGIDHMQAHVLAHFISSPKPEFPFLCLTVSGGHTQITRMDDYFTETTLGKTIDDAAGEAFDKTAKIVGLPYPGGPLIDQYAKKGNPRAFNFPVPNIPGYDFSFSGLKTSVLYFVRDALKTDPDFVEKNLADICASVQYAIIKHLMKKLEKAAMETRIKHVALAGGVSANSTLRHAVEEAGKKNGWQVFIPDFEYCTDNAAMIAIAAYHKYNMNRFTDLQATPYAGRPNL